MFLTLHSLDSWGRKRLKGKIIKFQSKFNIFINTKQKGYGYCEVPSKPGRHELTIKTWAPNQSIYAKVHEFFLGGQTKLYDIKKIA